MAEAPRQIRTSYDDPPIPLGHFDWSAWFDGDEEGHIGRGQTDQAAIADLLELAEDA
jgi:hypothetical protein